MRNDTSYRSYMSEQVYDKLNPARRGGMPNYDSSYKPEHHAYGYVVPFHVFFRCEAATRHIFKNASMGYDEMIWIQLKLKNWRWVAADVHIKA